MEKLNWIIYICACMRVLFADPLCMVLVCPDTIDDKPEWPMQECYMNFTQHWKGILRNRVYNTFVGS